MPHLPIGAQKIAGDTYYLPGLTNAGYVDGLMIDTGPNCEVCDGVAVDTLAITHGHTDHFAAGAQIRQRTGARVIATRDDARLVENPEVNIRGMFSWARPGDLLVTKLFLGVPCPVDGLVDTWEDPRARPVTLPGHTLGHTGYLTADKVLFTGDALYQTSIWDKHRLPYAIDPAMVDDSLARMLTIDFDWLVPGHGECCSREEAVDHIAFHRTQLAAIGQFILDSLAVEQTTEGVISLVSAERGLSDNPAQYWLAVTTVKGFLGDLLNQGKIEFFVREHAGWWRALR